MAEEGLIPRLINRWKFNREFSKEERDEIKRVKHQAYLDKLKYFAKLEGERYASEEMKEAMQILDNGKSRH
jgi:hypothetical protein